MQQRVRMLTFAAQLGVALDDGGRDAIAWVEAAIAGLSPGQWVLLLLAGAAIGWIVANARALSRLGPIDVQTLEHDDKEMPVKGLTAILREALAGTGLSPPPTVPSGTPQVNLLAAVEASNVSQAAWVAKLIEMLPRPRPHEYRISATLHGAEPAAEPAGDPAAGPYARGAAARAVARPADAAADAEPNTPCGISVWVRPAREGQELLQTYDGAATHVGAIQRAASEIYLHISNHAVDAFPLWARWRDREALAAYREGCKLRANDDIDGELAQLKRAAARERFNKLADLQLANIYEHQAQLQATDLRVALLQAFALRRYLEILEDANTIVEARYRTSVVASALATRCARMHAATARLVVDALELDVVRRPAQLVPALRALAERENRAVLQLLGPLYAVLNDGRVRTQFEPRAHQRRELKHSAGVSKHCVRARAVLDAGKSRGVDWDLRRREFAVRWLHLQLGRGSLNWQARYNAACFYALMLDRRRRLAAPRGGRETDEKLRGRAIDNLLRAVQEAGPELPRLWVERGDPDFDVFRTGGDPRWLALMRRLARREGEAPATWSETVAREATDEARRLGDRAAASAVAGSGSGSSAARKRAVPLPARPLGAPRLRFRGWLLVTLVLAAAAVTIGFALGLPWLLAVVLAAAPAALAVRAGHRAYVARWEAWPEVTEEGEGSTVGVGPAGGAPGALYVPRP